MKTLLLTLAAASALAACGQVEPGYVGIKVNQYGSGAGVDPTPLGVGRYWTPPGTQIKEYPVFTKNYTYSQSPSEGDPGNEEFVFQDKSGLPIKTDIAISYSVDPTLAPRLYSKYRTDGDGLLQGQVRNAIRNSLASRAATLDVQDIYGAKRGELLTQVQADVAARFAPFGLRVENLSYAGPLRLPQTVQQQITNRIANEQEALAAQANVATATANANAAVARATGEANANKLLADSIAAHPQIVQLKAIEKWNGQLPVYASNGPLPFIGNPKAGE